MRFSLLPPVSTYYFSLVLFSALIIIVTAQHSDQPQGTAFLSATPEAAARNLARARKYKPLVLIHHARGSLGVDKLTDPQLVAIKRTEECCIECITCNGLCANCECCNHHNA